VLTFRAGLQTSIKQLAFSPDGSVLAVTPGSDRTEFYSPTTGERLFVVNRSSAALGWRGPQRRTLISGTSGWGIDLDTRSEVPPPSGWTGDGYAAFSRDGAAGVNVSGPWQNPDMTGWRLTATSAEVVWQRPADRTRPIYREPHCFLTSEHFVRSERREGHGPLLLVVARWSDGQDVAETEFPNSAIGYHAVSPDGTLLALGANYGPSVHIYRTDDLAAKPVRLTHRERKWFFDIAFHPSGRFLAAANNDRVVTLFDAKTFSEVQSYAWKIGKLRAVTFSPEGTLAAVGSNTGKVVVWDVDM
jgi:WD40 repeat protein